MRVIVRLYAGILWIYPRAFRSEFGGAMRRDFADWSMRPAYRGAAGTMRLLLSVLLDVMRSAPAEWLKWTVDRRRERKAADAHPPSYIWSVIAGFAVLALYTATLAPSIAFWDSGEYVTVAHILGIPHPPGNPLFVLLAHGWEQLLLTLGLPPVVSINLFSAVLSAAAHALWFLVIERVLAGWSTRQWERRMAAGLAVMLSATAFTVWNQSNVTEKVYPLSLFTTALVTWLLFRWRDRGHAPRTLVLCAFVMALTATNHLMGVLVLPAAALFVAMVNRAALHRTRTWAAVFAVCALALSVQFFLPIRAAQRPLISEGAPACTSMTAAALSIFSWGKAGCEPLNAVLRREQYQKPSVFADPTDPSVPRGPELVGSQLLNFGQYLDWQWARGMAGTDSLFGGARPAITLLFVLLGLVGIHAQWRSDRAGAAYLALLFITLSVGLVLYLNFKYGYAIARDRFPGPEMHEVRERDYFFLIGFSIWGLFAGVGLCETWQRTAAFLSSRVRLPRLAAAPLLALAAIPLAVNWSWASRNDDFSARDWAFNVLMSVEPYGVLITNGDNDSFPLWYLQMVEGVRKDVVIVLSPYLNTPWYVKQVRDLSRPCPAGLNPETNLTVIVCQRRFNPSELPLPLHAYGWTHAQPPRDTILPLSDAEIEEVAAGMYVTGEQLVLRAGRIQATVQPGTPMFPADTFAALILRAASDDRPVYFMPGSQHVHRLGLFAYTLRQGLTWKIRNVGDPAALAPGMIPLAVNEETSNGLGAALDAPLTDTLLWDVYQHRGRVLAAALPWVDQATQSIPLQYAQAHAAAARAHALRGREASVQRHVIRANWWAERVFGVPAGTD